MTRTLKFLFTSCTTRFTICTVYYQNTYVRNVLELSLQRLYKWPVGLHISDRAFGM